ncbi:hypothetical protein [Mogibacterium timidum]|jgi:hypothetical protein|uniref:Uncharacterized protein n=1 Tax=Mogibacterium timidum ATCC 33093 TaxID=1401079 RepID=X8IRH0_9FIRM|nr:hypothetical protein [Mogibacterium timidum]EUC51794.1 hypothetical protein HMPREF0581_0646 [Mogibacterium timidum ATCC 33093]
MEEKQCYKEEFAELLRMMDVIVKQNNILIKQNFELVEANEKNRNIILNKLDKMHGSLRVL